jgi:hypothetical protein
VPLLYFSDKNTMHNGMMNTKIVTFFAKVITELAEFSQFVEYLTKQGKI